MVYEVRLGKPNHPTPLPPQRREIDTETLPYCIWYLRDGREILVNRKGAPIWERMPGRPARRSDPLEHVVGIVDKDYLYPASASPRSDSTIMRRCMKVLAGWKVAVTSGSDCRIR